MQYPEISHQDIAEWRRPRDAVIAETARRVAQIERDETREDDPPHKPTRRQETMNYSLAVFLINNDARAVYCTYNEHDGDDDTKKIAFKTLDQSVKVGDYVLSGRPQTLVRSAGPVGPGGGDRCLGRQRPTLGHPLGASAVHQLEPLVAVEPEKPERPGGEPVVVVTVEDDRRAPRYSRVAQKLPDLTHGE